jgi:hypothetical protein
MIPSIKKTLKQAQDNFSNIDMGAFNQKVSKAVKTVRDKIQNLKRSNTNNEISIKVNNKETSKQISQIEKQINSLQEKINARQLKLDIINPQIDKIVTDTTTGVTPDGINNKSGVMDNTVNNALESNKDFTKLSAQAQKLYTEIEVYNKALDVAKSKMAQLNQQTANTSASQGRLTSFFNAFKQKIEQVKPSINSINHSLKQMPNVTKKVSENAGKIGSSFKGGLKHIFKYALALFSLRGIYSILSNSASSWLSSQNEEAQQLSANIEYLKNSLGSALAPIIKFITNLVYELLKSVQSLIYVFSGVNIFAKATASSMKSTASSAKSLGGIHNEINNVQEKDDSGEKAPSMDLSKLEKSTSGWMIKFKEELQELFKPIQNSWNIYGQKLIDSLKGALTNLIGLINTIRESFKKVWLNGTGEKTVSLLLQGWTSVANIIGNISRVFTEAWTNGEAGTQIIQNLWDGFNNIFSIVISIYQAFEEWTASESFQTFANAIIGICVTLSSWFTTITQKLREIWDNGGNQAFNSLLNVITKTMEIVNTVLQVLSPIVDYIINVVGEEIQGIVQIIGYLLDAIGGILDFIIGIFTGDWERAWQGICDFFIGIWNAIKTAITTILNGISNLWSAIWNGISSVFTNIWNGIKNIAVNMVISMRNSISTALNAIKNIWSNVWNGIKNVITNVWNGIWGTIRSVINWILSGIENMVNGVIRGVNYILSGISSIANAVGGLVGMNPVNLRIGYVSLPRLAKGGVLTEATAVIAGEYSGAKSNPEIITPQSIMYETMLKAISDSNEGKDTDTPINLTVCVGNKKIGDILLENLRDIKRQTGKNIEALVG